MQIDQDSIQAILLEYPKQQYQKGLTEGYAHGHNEGLYDGLTAGLIFGILLGISLSMMIYGLFGPRGKFAISKRSKQGGPHAD